MWPGFDSRTRCHKWVEFVVGSRPCSEGFSPSSVSRITVMCNPRKIKLIIIITYDPCSRSNKIKNKMEDSDIL